MSSFGPSRASEDAAYIPIAKARGFTPLLINFVDDSFDIRKTMDRVEKESTSPKTKSSNRVVPMPHFVMVALKEYLDLFSYPPDCIFATSYNAIERRFHNRIKKAGINDIRPYDLRHSHVSYLVHKKVPITAISKRLGHKNPKITLEFYSFMYAEDGADIASLLEESGQNQVKGYIDSSNNALPAPLIID